MEKVLSTSMHRRIALLNLLRAVNRWLYLDEIADKINCSKKTIISDCQYIEERWSDILTIETSQKNGIRLVETPNRSIHEIYKDIIRESVSFSLLEEVFFTPGESGEYWAKHFFLSESSLYRQAKKVEVALKNRNMSLNRSPYQIEGTDERQIRYFFTTYFYEVYGIHDWPFPLDKQKIFLLVERIIDDLALKFNDSQFIDLAFSIAVSIIRERQGNLIDRINKDDPDYLARVKKFQSYTESVKEIVEPLNVELPDNWSDDFSYSIFWWEFGWDNPQEKIRIHELGEEMTVQIAEALNIPVSNHSRENICNLVEDIYAKHKMFPYQKYIVYNRGVYSSFSIQRNYLVFTAVVKKLLKMKEERFGFPWYSMYFDEMLYELMVRWQSLPDILDSLRHQVKVGVYSDLGSEHAELLACFLRKNFGDKISIFVQDRPYYELQGKEFPTFELNVANFAIDEMEEKKLFIVEDIPTFKNLLDLRQRIDRQRLVLPEDIAFLRS